jgi:hypothetical protein
VAVKRVCSWVGLRKTGRGNSHICDQLTGRGCAKDSLHGVENAAMRSIDTIEKSLR